MAYVADVERDPHTTVWAADATEGRCELQEALLPLLHFGDFNGPVNIDGLLVCCCGPERLISAVEAIF